MLGQWSADSVAPPVRHFIQRRLFGALSETPGCSCPAFEQFLDGRFGRSSGRERRPCLMRHIFGLL
jgi:hypothetical protein